MTRAAVLACALGVLLVAPSAAAAGLRVEEGTHVDEVKAIGEDVRIDGTTSGPVVVIDGDLTVGPRGRVNGAAVVGGRIATRPGGRISGEVFHVAGEWPSIPAWQIGGVLLALVALRMALCWALVSAAVQLSERPVAEALSVAGRLRPLKTLAVGGLAAFGIGAGALVAALTVVGLAVAAALAGMLLAATIVGTALALRAAGPTRANKRLRTVALVLPLTGDAVAALAAILGMGAVLRHLVDRAAEAPGARDVLALRKTPSPR